MKRFQLRSYVAAIGSEEANDLLTTVMDAFVDWPPTDDNRKVSVRHKDQVKFFTGKAEGMLKVFVLIPLDETEVLEANWNPVLLETIKDNVEIELKPTRRSPKLTPKSLMID